MADLNVEGAVKLMVVTAKDKGATVNKETVRAMFHSLLGGIQETLANDGKVMFTGFGTFSLKEKAGRKGVTPSGVAFKTDSRLYPKFKPHKKFMEEVQG